MTPGFAMDRSRWQQAAQILFRTSSRELPDFLNGQQFKIGIEALRHTERANRAQVEAALGQVATAIRSSTSRKTGKTSFKRSGRILRDDSFAARILLRRFQLTGDWGVKGDTLAQKAANLIASRVRSINFIRSGWIPAIRILEGLVFKKPRITSSGKEVRTYGVPKGGARPARNGINIRSEIFNTALNTNPKAPSVKGNPYSVGERGLRRAFRNATADMQREYERRMNGMYRLVSAK